MFSAAFFSWDIPLNFLSFSSRSGSSLTCEEVIDSYFWIFWKNACYKQSSSLIRLSGCFVNIFFIKSFAAVDTPSHLRLMKTTSSSIIYLSILGSLKGNLPLNRLYIVIPQAQISRGSLYESGEPRVLNTSGGMYWGVPANILFGFWRGDFSSELLSTLERPKSIMRS